MVARLAWFVGVAVLFLNSAMPHRSHAAGLTILDRGTAKVSVIVAPDATPSAKQAADDLIT